MCSVAGYDAVVLSSEGDWPATIGCIAIRQAIDCNAMGRGLGGFHVSEFHCVACCCRTPAMLPVISKGCNGLCFQINVGTDTVNIKWNDTEVK